MCTTIQLLNTQKRQQQKTEKAFLEKHHLNYWSNAQEKQSSFMLEQTIRLLSGRSRRQCSTELDWIVFALAFQCLSLPVQPSKCHYKVY